MISRLGLAVSRLFERTAPDPFVIAIGLTVLTALLAMLFGRFELVEGQTRAGALIDAWGDPSIGLWRFLAFGMQMCLILVTGHALASTRPIRRGIDALSRLPRGTAGAAGMISLVACLAGLVNWGLGLIVGALLAREVGRSLAQRGIRAHYPLLAAAGYSTMMLWHGGFSGSAPLTMSSERVAAGVLDASMIERVREAVPGNEANEALVPLTQTIVSPLNLLVTGGLLIIVPLLVMLLAPKREQDLRAIDEFVEIVDDGQKQSPSTSRHEPAVPDRLNRSLTIALVLAVGLIFAVWRYVTARSWDQISLNEINATMFALGLILHGSPKAYMDSITEAAGGCGGIIIQFPLYGGIMGMMQASGLVTQLAEAFARIGNETTMPLLSFFAAGIVNLFVPSGGGQWAIQGPIALEAGFQAGVEPGRMIMAVAYGDQLTNMLQPFWALPLLAITGVKARDIVGYTCVVMVVAALWMCLGLLFF